METKQTKIMKSTLETLLFVAVSFMAFNVAGQEMSGSESLSHFNKIVVSPRVSIILQKGDKESIRMIYNDIPKNKVNVIVKGNKLRIYLDHARITERQVRNITINNNSNKHGIYEGSSITAYVTYTDLKSIEIRGEGEIRCDSMITAQKFKVKAYGENEIHLASVITTKFKATLFGQNDFKILAGSTDHQTYRLFGENKVDTRGFKSEIASTRIYGEGKISVYASEAVRINALGESTIYIEGTPMISKRIILGRTSVRVNR